MKNLEQMIDCLEKDTALYEAAQVLGLEELLYPNFHEEAKVRGEAIKGAMRKLAEPELDGEELNKVFANFLIGLIEEMAETEEDRLDRKLAEVTAAVSKGTESVSIDSSTAPSDEYLDMLVASIIEAHPDLLVKVDGNQVSSDKVTYGVDPDETDIMGLAMAMFEDMIESGTLDEVDEVRFTANNDTEEELVSALTKLFSENYPEISVEGKDEPCELLYAELSGLLHSGAADSYINKSRGLCPDAWLYLADKYDVVIKDIHIVDSENGWMVTFIGSNVTDVTIEK